MESNVKKAGNDSLNIITLQSWLLLVAIFLLAVAYGCWMIFGVTTVKISTKGLLNTHGDVFEIHHNQPGLLTNYTVSRNDYVTKGQAVAKIYPWDGITPLDDLETLSNESIDVTSPVSGYITDLNLPLWSKVDISTSIVTVVDDYGKGLTYVLAFVDPSYVSELKLGMKADVSLEGENHKEYNNLKGKIIDISDTHVDSVFVYQRTGYLNKLQSDAIDSSPLYAAFIELDTSENGNLLLSNGETAPDNLYCNALCDVTFTLSEMHPYEKLFGGK